MLIFSQSEKIVVFIGHLFEHFKKIHRSFVLCVLDVLWSFVCTYIFVKQNVRQPGFVCFDKVKTSKTKKVTLCSVLFCSAFLCQISLFFLSEKTKSKKKCISKMSVFTL